MKPDGPARMPLSLRAAIKRVDEGGDSVTADQLTALVRERQGELRSLAAEVAQGRRAGQDARPAERRPLHLRLVTALIGLR